MKQNSSPFTKIKSLFVDRPDIFIQTDSISLNVNRTLSVLDHPFRLVIIYGEPGVGKSVILNKIKEMKPQTYLIASPLIERESFKEAIEKAIGDSLDNIASHDDFSHTILIDEAQVYPEEMLEYIRILADTRKIRFILALHNIKDEFVLTKKHFESRIFDTIEILPLAKKELGVYIQKKLIAQKLGEYYELFSKKHIDWIYNFTKGNLRQTNKFLYNLFHILEYFDTHKPSELQKPIKWKFLEMCAIKMGYIDA